jgi:hypothetical protein
MWQEAMYSFAAGGSRLERQWARRERSVVQVEREARWAAFEVRQSAMEAGAAREEPARRARMVMECIVVVREKRICLVKRVKLSTQGGLLQCRWSSSDWRARRGNEASANPGVVTEEQSKENERKR